MFGADLPPGSRTPKPNADDSSLFASPSLALVVTLLVWAAAIPLVAAGPMLNDLQPRGGQRGRTFTLELKGERLAAEADLITSLPGTITKLAPPREGDMGSTLAYLIHASR